jgi:tRNA A37 threonylcarbamoyladenosine dehydratase
MLFTKEGLEKLREKRVAIFGLGGVGGYVLEALVRSGIENFDLIDNDVVSESNINRQILATIFSVGKDKVEVAKERALSINENCNIKTYKTFFLPENSNEFDFCKYNLSDEFFDVKSFNNAYQKTYTGDKADSLNA